MCLSGYSTCDSLVKAQLLQIKRELEGEVAAGVEDADAAGAGVGVGVLEAAQVVLVGFVRKVGCNQVQAGDGLTANHYVSAGRGAKKGVGRSGCLGVVQGEDSVLLEVPIKIQR